MASMTSTLSGCTSCRAWTTGLPLRDGRGSVTNSHMASVSASRSTSSLKNDCIPQSLVWSARASAGWHALPRAIPLANRVLSRYRILISKEEDQQRPSNEATNVRPEGNPAHILAAQRRKAADELQQEPEPNHHPGRDEQNLSNSP